MLPAVGLHKRNTNWLLTDYTKDNGALCIVPGSHKLCRHPKQGEGVEDAVPVEAPAGSVCVIHGNLWHGAFPRINPGLRITIVADYCGRHFAGPGVDLDPLAAPVAGCEIPGFPVTPEQATEGAWGNPGRLGNDFAWNPRYKAGDDQFSDWKRYSHANPWCGPAIPHII